MTCDVISTGMPILFRTISRNPAPLAAFRKTAVATAANCVAPSASALSLYLIRMLAFFSYSGELIQNKVIGC